MYLSLIRQNEFTKAFNRGKHVGGPLFSGFINVTLIIHKDEKDEKFLVNYKKMTGFIMFYV